MNILNFPLGAFHVLYLKRFWEGLLIFGVHGMEARMCMGKRKNMILNFGTNLSAAHRKLFYSSFLIFGVIWHGSQIPVAAARPRAHIIKKILSA